MDKIIVKKNKTINKTMNKIINEYVKKICEFDNLNKTFDEKLINITTLTDNLIDYCIKKKILFFIENKISYTSIVKNFKLHLTKFIKELVDPNDVILNKYIMNINDDNISMGWDNISDINSIIFKNFKNLNETFEKNVSFGYDTTITNHNETHVEFNNDIHKLNELTNDKIVMDDRDIDNKILPIYIKLLINQNKYLIEFTHKLISMCDILSDNDIKYKKVNPYN